MTIALDIRPWSDGDLPLLERLLGDPAMTVHLGGPETPEQIRERQERYARFSLTGPGCMFVVLIGPDKIPAGSVGYWEKEWQGAMVWESGWSVLPEFQGQRVAAKATALVIVKARAEKKHRYIHAFPSIHNTASNAICRKSASPFKANTISSTRPAASYAATTGPSIYSPKLTKQGMKMREFKLLVPVFAIMVLLLGVIACGIGSSQNQTVSIREIKELDLEDSPLFLSPDGQHIAWLGLSELDSGCQQVILPVDGQNNDLIELPVWVDAIFWSPTTNAFLAINNDPEEPGLYYFPEPGKDGRLIQPGQYRSPVKNVIDGTTWASNNTILLLEGEGENTRYWLLSLKTE